MANPRKFSEKIALHNQKQAEETAAFEAIMREVSTVSTPRMPTSLKQAQHLQLAANQQNLGTYRGGSLPNVNQMAANSIDLQSALHSLEGMKQSSVARQSLAERIHRDRQARQLQQQQQQQTRARNIQFDKRADYSPYGTPYLSPPPDTSWRRTASDSALHTSTMTPHGVPAVVANANAPIRRETVGQEPTQQPVNPLDGDPLRLPPGHRPKSCDVPGINIYPSPETEPSNSNHVSVSNNTGSLPDLTNIQFPSPLATPIDAEDMNFSNAEGGEGLNHASVLTHQNSESSTRTRTQPCPLVLRPLAPNPTGQDVEMLSPLRQQLPNTIYQQNIAHSPSHSLHRLLCNTAQPTILTVPPRDPSHGNPQAGVYRTNSSPEPGVPASPTSPHSQTSCSPTQSPGMSPGAAAVLAAGGALPTSLQSVPSSALRSFSDSYYPIQGDPQTALLQHQFQQFNMPKQDSLEDLLHAVNVSYPSENANGQLPQLFLDNMNTPLSTSHDVPLCQQSRFFPNLQVSITSPTSTGQSPISSADCDSPGKFSSPTLQTQNAPLGNGQIPDIVLTGVDEVLLAKQTQDFAKDIGSAMAGVLNDGLDVDLFSSDLKVGLDPLDLDGLQILDESTLVTDPATEDSFRLDRL